MEESRVPRVPRGWGSQFSWVGRTQPNPTQPNRGVRADACIVVWVRVGIKIPELVEPNKHGRELKFWFKQKNKQVNIILVNGLVDYGKGASSLLLPPPPIRKVSQTLCWSKDVQQVRPVNYLRKCIVLMIQMHNSI